jgi:penicillin amidase
MRLDRRAFVAALLAGTVGGVTLTEARSYLDRFAALSGGVHEAATRSVPGRVASPYGSATVRYDDAGVPTVEAGDERALYFAVGYVHAADRLFQMDLFRRRMGGTLAAAVGERGVESDLFHARMDFRGAAEANWEAIRDTSTGDALEAYVAGVEAYRTREALPIEFGLLDYEPDPWTPVASMLVEKQLAWGLTGSFRSLRKATAADELGSEVAESLFPARMDHDVPVIREEGATAERSAGATTGSGEADAGSAGESEGDAADLGTLRGDDSATLSNYLSDFESPRGIGSNSWLVSGGRTASGRPLVANDPHLTLIAPPIWYGMYQRSPAMAVDGVTFPGVPFVVIGQNGAGAWGFTNTGADVLDVYTYETDGDRYRDGDEWREFDTEERTVEVSGGDDRTVTVRKSLHGPVIGREGTTVGVAWTGFQASRTARAIHELDRSAGREEAVAAIEKFDSPTQNVVYADREGNTYYGVTGLIPVRETDGDVVRGDRVFDGSAREGEWPGYAPYGAPDRDTGWIPFEEKPQVRDPDYLATANQRVVDDPDYYLSEAYSAPFRARRLYDLLDGRAASDDPFDFAYMEEVQLDTRDERAALFADVVLDARDAMGERARDAADAIEDWDYRMDRDSRGALVFARFVEHYRSAVFEETLDSAGLDGAYYPNDWVLLTLDADSFWFRDPPAGEARERADVVATALDETAAELDEEGWNTYGDYNRTAIDHPFGLGFLNYPRLPTDGSPATVRNFRVESGAGTSYRLLARFDGEPSLGVIPGGNDGDYFSEHYHDQLEAWADGEYLELAATTDGAVDVRFRGESDE